MLPLNELSSKATVRGYSMPVKQPGDFLVDWEMGGIALNDSSKGLNFQLWTLEVKKHPSISNEWNVFLFAESVAAIILFSAQNITSASLAFDQNMRPFVAFVQNDQAKIYWYDSLVGAQITSDLAIDVRHPVCCVDEHRSFNVSNSDIILAYIRSGWLRYRQQRDRYTIEYDLCEVGDAELLSVAMNVGLQLQFRIRHVTANTDDGRFKVFASPLLSDVVMALCRRKGIEQKNINVNELYDTEVIGYKCNTDDGLNKRIDALREVFFFDKCEVDKKITFPRRGNEIVARIPYDDLIADDPSALKRTLIQEKDLPRSVTVNHLDPAGGFAGNSQIVRRKSNLIAAKKDLKLESEVVLTADQAMTAAIVKLKIAWHEQSPFEFATFISYSFIVPTDVVEVEDAYGFWHRIRITERNEDGVVIKFEGVQDAGKAVYASLGIGNSLPPPVSTTPGLAGETRAEILNIPALREQDDELGVYLGVCGQSSAWTGAQILISTDQGANFYEATEIQTPATIGDTLSDLQEEINAEYQANQSFEVLVNFPLESVSKDNLLKNINRCVVGDEILQFQFASFLGMQDAKYKYRLSGLIRGRYATIPEYWPQDTRFVLLDSSIVFIQAQQWMLGRELEIKPVSLGLTEDETIATSYDFDEGVSQREFPVYNLKTARDLSNSVTVSFIGRARLGIETAPINGKYFKGYRIKFSDGFFYDTQVSEYSRNSCPIGVSVQVCALNSITGEGPYSESVLT